MKRSTYHVEDEHDSSSFQLPERVGAIMDYAKAEWEYSNVMRKRGQSLMNDDLSFETQARQIILWSHNIILDAFLSNRHKRKVMKLWKTMVPNLELIIRATHVVKARNAVKSGSNVTQENDYDKVKIPSLLDMTRDAMSEEVGTKLPKSKKKLITKRKEQAKKAISAKREGNNDIKSSVETLLTENITLTEILCSVNEKRLRRDASKLMLEIVQLIVTVSRPKSQKNSDASRKVSNQAGSLNKRAKALKASWKNTPKDQREDILPDSFDGEENYSKSKDIRWKGKSRVQLLRRHNLSLHAMV